MIPYTWFFVVLMATAALAACGQTASLAPTESAESGSASVTIGAKDNFFDPKTVTVKAGEPVKVTFVNKGRNAHEVEIKGLISETMLQPGESRSFTVTPEAKSYKMYCEIHEDQGMEGEFIAE